MKFGICCGPTSLSQEGESLQSSVERLMDAMQSAGADYVEVSVGSTQPEGDIAVWEELRDALKKAPLKVEAFNIFLPKHHRITGPDVDLHRVLEYCRIALGRCREVGGEIVVLGSSGARKVPEGFAHDEARRQFVQFCQEVGPVAQDAGITIVLEPLNRREDNLLTSVSDGATIIDEVGHPNLQLIADLYHMAEEKEPMANITAAGNKIRHTHVADRGRVAPGYSTQGEEDFIGFFRALRQANYHARCSFEGSFSDMSTQLKPSLNLMRQRWEESAL